MARNAPKPAIINVLPTSGKRLLALSEIPSLGILTGFRCGVALPKNAEGELDGRSFARDGVNADFAGAKICPAADILAKHTPHLSLIPKLGMAVTLSSVESGIQIDAMIDVTYLIKISFKNATKLFHERLSATEL